SNGESGGFQIMYQYSWTQGHSYKFQLKVGPSGTDAQGKWWGVTVTDLNTSTSTFVGEQREPVAIGGLSSTQWSEHTSMFGEDLHWWRSLDGGTIYPDCSLFQNSSMVAKDITANGTIL